jgi:hypothetical protein
MAGSPREYQVEDLAAGSPVLGQEVEIKSRHVPAAGAVREEEARERAPHVLQVEDRLGLGSEIDAAETV